MSNNALVCECKEIDSSCSDVKSDDSVIYQAFIYKCPFNPGCIHPSKRFSIRSYNNGVKSQQCSDSEDCCGCCGEPPTLCCWVPAPHPTVGFQLVEYADKCCSQVKFPVKTRRSYHSVATSIVSRKKSVKYESSSGSSVTCISSRKEGVKTSTKPCLKRKPSTIQIKSSCKVLCKKCHEKRKKKKKKKQYEKCHCQNVPEVYYQKECNCVKDKLRRVDECVSRFECERSKCKYFNLIHRIKCIFTKGDNP